MDAHTKAQCRHERRQERVQTHTQAHTHTYTRHNRHTHSSTCPTPSGLHILFDMFPCESPGKLSKHLWMAYSIRCFMSGLELKGQHKTLCVLIAAATAAPLCIQKGSGGGGEGGGGNKIVPCVLLSGPFSFVRKSVTRHIWSFADESVVLWCRGSQKSDRDWMRSVRHTWVQLIDGIKWDLAISSVTSFMLIIVPVALNVGPSCSTYPSPGDKEFMAELQLQLSVFAFVVYHNGIRGGTFFTSLEERNIFGLQRFFILFYLKIKPDRQEIWLCRHKNCKSWLNQTLTGLLVSRKVALSASCIVIVQLLLRHSQFCGLKCCGHLDFLWKGSLLRCPNCMPHIILPFSPRKGNIRLAPLWIT